MAITILWKKKDNHYLSGKLGFTMVEMLLALCFFAMIMFSMQSVVQNYFQIQQTFSQSKLPEWQQFLLLLEKELKTLQVKSASNKQIKVVDPKSNKEYRIILKNNKIYREIGHHPYIYGVKDWEVVLYDSILFIELLTLDNQYFQGVISDVFK